MSRKNENTGFLCENCGEDVLPLSNGSYRNHCPYCLYSKHVDKHRPGDRTSGCGGKMKPTDLSYHSKKGYQIVHVCETCKTVQLNKTAEDPVQPDELIWFMRQLARE